jgi:hypothetical protein
MKQKSISGFLKVIKDASSGANDFEKYLQEVMDD